MLGVWLFKTPVVWHSSMNCSSTGLHYIWHPQPNLATGTHTDIMCIDTTWYNTINDYRVHGWCSLSKCHRELGYKLYPNIPQRVGQHGPWQERILEHFGEASIKPLLEDLLYHAKDVRVEAGWTPILQVWCFYSFIEKEQEEQCTPIVPANSAELRLFSLDVPGKQELCQHPFGNFVMQVFMEPQLQGPPLLPLPYHLGEHDDTNREWAIRGNFLTFIVLNYFIFVISLETSCNSVDFEDI